MSIEFKKITIKNFLSYGKKPTVIELDRPGRTTFVVGKDMDDTSLGIKGNGVGKTTMLNALVFAVYNKPVSNISMENLVNNVNKKDMEVTVEFEKDGKPYAIRRIRKGKTGASVHLFEGTKDITPDSIKMTSEKIEEIMGAPYELFVRIVAFSANHQPFLDLPNTHASQANQKDIIEELFEMKVISERAEKLKQLIKDTKADLRLQSAHVEQLREEHTRHGRLVLATEKRVESWKDENAAEIENIKVKLKKTEGIDIDEQHKLHEYRSELEAKLQDAYTEQREIERTLKGLIKTKKEAENELEHLQKAECPYCHQTYKDNEWKIVDREQAIDMSDAEMEKEGEKLQGVDTKIERLESNKKELEEKIQVDNIKELIDIRSKQDQYKDRLKRLGEETNPHIETLKELEEFQLEDIDTSKVEELEDELTHQEFLLKALTKKDSFVRKKLLNTKIPFLNQRLEKYLKVLGLPHSVRFTEEMTVNITRFGRKLDFGNLSNGQQARLNFALSLAFRDMLENVHGKINVYMLDEVLDVGLDSIGITAAAKLLKNKARDEGLSVYIISHKDELSNAFDSKMTVTMNKGFSYIEE